MIHSQDFLLDVLTVSRKMFLYLTTSLIAFFSPIYGAIIMTVFMVIADTVTGVMVAGKDNVKNITSDKAFPIIPKTMMYISFLVVAQMASSIIDAQIPWVKLALIGIAWIEVKSIDENFQKLTGFSFLDKVFEAFKKIQEIKKK